MKEQSISVPSNDNINKNDLIKIRDLIIAGILLTGFYILLYFFHSNIKIFIDIITGLYISILIVIALAIYEKKKMEDDYKYLSSDKWLEYCPFDDGGYGSHFNFSSHTGKAQIKYLNNNILIISLTTMNKEGQPTDTWRGHLMMSKELTKYGRLVWKYDSSNLGSYHSWGIKECYILSDDKFDYIHFVSNPDGRKFGIEEIIDRKDTIRKAVPPYGNALLRKERKG